MGDSMIKIEHDKTNQLSIEAVGALQLEDFDKLAKVADELIVQHGKIRILINGSQLEGWRDFATMKKHFNFVRARHYNVEKIAIIIGPWWQNLMFSCAKMFIHPTAKSFKLHEVEAAKKWLQV